LQIQYQKQQTQSEKLARTEITGLVDTVIKNAVFCLLCKLFITADMETCSEQGRSMNCNRAFTTLLERTEFHGG
jgi:hypothetical protein